MAECRYELKHPFEYGYKGDLVNANFITLSAPNYGQMEKVIPIKQALAAAMKERFASVDTQQLEEAKEIAAEKAEDHDEDADDTGLDSSFILALLFQWSGNLTKVFKNAESLFLSGVALVDGETKVTSALINKMDMCDFEGLVGTYLVNFIIPSLTDGH